jgi:uncharacterized protein (TIGR01244 family)
MTYQIRHLTDDFAVTGQLSADDIPAIAAQGFKTLINNRPDGEAGPAQPPSEDIERAARAAGLAYVYLPVVSGRLTPADAVAMKQALAAAPTPVLAFCRSGARSANLYVMAQTAP